MADNHLRIIFPEASASFGEISLNGKRLEDVISFKIESTASEMFVKATIEFATALEFESAGDVASSDSTLTFKAR